MTDVVLSSKLKAKTVFKVRVKVQKCSSLIMIVTIIIVLWKSKGLENVYKQNKDANKYIQSKK